MVNNKLKNKALLITAGITLGLSILIHLMIGPMLFDGEYFVLSLIVKVYLMFIIYMVFRFVDAVLKENNEKTRK